jgi:hypothetical protein
MTGASAGTLKPDGAWTPEETVRYVRNHGWMQFNDYAIPRYMFDSVCQGDFYIICPDNETCVLLYASICHILTGMLNQYPRTGSPPDQMECCGHS